MSKKENSRTLLPNGCSCSQISVTPKNWKQLKKITGPWRIHFRFYDPTKPEPIQVFEKGMNKYKDVAQRKQQTEFLIDTILQGLRSGYNPFHKKVVISRRAKYDIEPNTFFIDALKRSLERIDIEPAYKKHIGGYIIPNLEKAAKALNYSTLFISELKRKHIIFMLDHLQEVNKRFSDNTFNRFRTDLKILLKELARIEAIESNPIDDNFPVKQLEVKEKIVLSPQEITYVNNLLLEKSPELHNYLQIFFHSGSRNTELFRIKGRDVDLTNQRLRREIRKGRKARTVWTPIKNIAVQYWVKALENCGPDQYVFSTNLKPGDKPGRPIQATKRWYRIIKKKFVYNSGRKSGKGKFIDRVHIINGKETVITADWNKLRHLNTTQMMNILKKKRSETPEKRIAELNGHSEAMVIKIYDLEHQKRENEDVKQVYNPFA